MCGIQGGVAAATNAGMTTQVAGASGGGLVAGASGDVDVMAKLQALAAQVEALSAAIGGTSLLGTTAPAAPTATTTAGGPVQGDPTQGDPTQAGHVHGANGTEKQHGKGHAKGKGHGAHVIQRDTPVNEARAEKIAKAVKSFFGDFKRSDVDVNKGGKGTHGVLKEKDRKAFAKAHPGLPIPRTVVFGKDGGKTALGVVFNEGTEGKFDLGMGTMHKHGDKKSANAMQHVWFTPENLEVAYTDQGNGIQGKVEQMVTGKRKA